MNNKLTLKNIAKPVASLFSIFLILGCSAQEKNKEASQNSVSNIDKIENSVSNIFIPSSSFSYEITSDEFSGKKVSKAVARSYSDLDNGIAVEMSFICKEVNTISPWDASLLQLEFFGKNTQPINYYNISIKFNDKSPSDQEIGWLNTSSNYNIFESPFHKSLVYFYEGRDRSRLLQMFRDTNRARVVNWDDGEYPKYAFSQAAISLSSVMVRFSNDDGKINTVKFNTKNKNFEKVLKDCSWDKEKDIWENYYLQSKARHDRQEAENISQRIAAKAAEEEAIRAAGPASAK